ncbi:MAG: hypothetical protein AMJ53_06085 [Gammaproteobacteria bacterium SG8_11]|nr:MAG: hypothetical protein AMJ53_06085 [Gammaproteobacteria bacterium SG8_11]
MNSSSQTKNPQLGVAVLRRTLLLVALWWLLSKGDSLSWLVGLPAVTLAVVVSFKLTPPRPSRWRPLAVLRFIPFFMLESLRGGWDVSLRVFHPALPINPGILQYTTRLPAGLPRMLLLNVTSLLPGTLSADLQDNQLTLHVLDRDASIAAELRRLESRIADLFRFNQAGESP